MNEPDLRELLSAYLDAELPAGDHARVEEALAKDESLRAELDALRSVDALFRADAQAASAPDVLADRVRASLAQAQGTAGKSGRIAPFPSWRVSAPLAAAAGLVAAFGLAWQFSGDGSDRYQVADAPQLGRQVEPEVGTMMMRSVEEPPAAPMAEADLEVAEGAAVAMSEAHRMAAPSVDSASDAFAGDATEVGEGPQVMSLQPLAAEPPVVQQMGELQFHLGDGRWIQEGYAGESLTPMPREDARWLAFTEAGPMRALRALPERIVVQVNEEWAEIEALPGSITTGPLE